MTAPIYGYDVSEHNPDFDHAQAYKEGYRFAMARTSQGTYRDKWFKRHMTAIRKTDLLFAAYHYVWTSAARDQAATVAAMIGDKSVPVFLDSELGSSTEGQNWDVAQALRKLGYRVIGNYFPEWYWQQVGRPKLRLGPLWSSKYVTGTGPGSTLYQSVPASYWGGYGGQDVALLQFTSKAKIAGMVVDASAFRGTMAELEALFGAKTASTPPAAPTPAAAVPTVEGIPLGSYHTSGTKILWRPLYHNNNVQATKTCFCVTQAIAIAEARLKKVGVIKQSLDFWQFGYGQAAAASADTHAAGGVVDTVQTDTTTQKVLREVGFAGAWERGPSAKLGNFSTHHIHAVLAGCPHVSNGAADQIVQVKNGQNGLANHGPDYGPKVPFITWQDAWTKYVTETVVAAPTQNGLIMADPIEYKRSKNQNLKASKNWQPLLVDDSGKLYRLAYAPATVDIECDIVVNQPGCQARFVVLDWKPGASRLVTAYPPKMLTPGGDQLHLYNKISGPGKGYPQRIIRLQVFAPVDVAVTNLMFHVGKE